MKLGIKDGKIWDICSDLRNKRDNSILDIDYLDLPRGDWVTGDTFLNNISLKDSPIRLIEKPKSELELLREEMEVLKNRIKDLEEK